MERLAHLIEKEVSNGRWKGAKASRNGPLITHLAFADDLILFSEASVEQAQLMMDCLNLFCQASGSKVNIEKSKIHFSNNTDSTTRTEVCSCLRMDSTEDFGQYLGVPTINGRSSKREYQYLVDRINGKLAGWKAKTLSMAGRSTLIQASLSSIPMYTMQSTKLPRSTCDDLDRKCRGFLWGENDGERKVHMVSWETVTKPRCEGGLGLKSMRQANSAFLAKLGWRVLAEPEALWARVLRAKYCDNRCDIDMFKTRANASNAWRGIISNIDIVNKGISMAVGGGNRTLFWHHRWATTEPLITLAHTEPPPQLQGLSVREVWDDNNGWKSNLFAEYLPAEVLETIASHELVENEDAVDEVYWNGSSSGGFTLASALQLVRNEFGPTEEIRRGWKTVWKAPVPQRIRLFLWLAIQGRLMTNGNRFVRGLTDNPRCYACGEIEETGHHILRDCALARLVWRKFEVRHEFFRENVPIKDWILNNLNLEDAGMGEEWPRIFAVACWWLWKWRNARCFEENPNIPMDQFSFILTQTRNIREAMKHGISDNNGNSVEKRATFIRWRGPRVGWFQLCTDGASKGNPGLAGAGGILRGLGGEFIEAFAKNCGRCSCTKAELYGVLQGLVLARQRGCSKLEVKMDSEVVLHMLRDETPLNSPYVHLIRKCKALVSLTDWEITLGHCYRNWLANFGVGLEEKLKIFHAIPRELGLILSEDISGVAFARAVPSDRVT